MGNPSNGPVAVTWLKYLPCFFIMSLHVISGHIGHCVEALTVCVVVTFITPGLIWSQVVTLITVEVKGSKALYVIGNFFKKSE